MSEQEQLPIWSYQSDTRGIGGTLKEQIEDFTVEEHAEHNLDNGDHTVFRLTKHNMTTLEAIKTLSDILHVSRKRFGYAGNKDKRAVTTQYMSVEDVEPEELERGGFLPDIDIEVVGKGDRIGIGNLSYNAFDITIRDINLPEDIINDRITNVVDELDGRFPNYFGRQRFGSVRPITHQVGKHILSGNFEEAVWTYIAKPYDNEHEKVRKVREDLWETRDVERSAEKFPEQYRYEKILLYHIANQDDDYKGAIKRLPDGLQRLFIHSYQSYVFNKTLSHLIEENDVKDNPELPLIGYKTTLGDKKGHQEIKNVLEGDDITLQDFKLREMEHLRMEGDYRPCMSSFKEFNLNNVDSDDLNINKNKVNLTFSLPKGTYATVFLREIMKSDE